MTSRAWVTLATNDSYGLGALVLAHSLRRVASTYPAVVLITPTVTDAMRERLRAVFTEVITVDVLDSQDAAHLALLQRPELGITFTKIHCWNLTQYEKCVFLDADILVVQNCDELFEREELTAAPDVGWPDCFNSGVFVFKPSSDTFSRLITFAQERGSFDGGDQGLLNSFFSDWSSDNNKRLPFLYNVTSGAFYSYLPALKHFGQNLKIIHFIGPAKPWLQHYNFESQSVDAPEHLKGFLQLWWDLFTSQVHTQLDVTMANLEEPSSETRRDVEELQSEFPHGFEQRLDYATYEPALDSTSEFPWHHPDKQVLESDSNELDKNDFFDPWDRYRGNILPHSEDSRQSWEDPDPNEVRKYAWDRTQHVSHGPSSNEHNNFNQSITPHDNLQNNYHHANKMNHEHSAVNYNTQNCNNHDHINHSSTHNPYTDYHAIYKEPQNNTSKDFNDNNSYEINKSSNDSQISQNKNHQVYCVHMDSEKPVPKPSNEDGNHNELLNGDVCDESHYDDVRPRHPYDGFYLRHKMTIDSHGKKMCSHEIPPPSPSPPPEIPENNEDEDDQIENGFYLETEDETGVAGNLARVQPGVPLQREAVDELSRRQGWESGNIDYMGADSFANIWAKISETLSQGTSSPPKQPSPPKECYQAPLEKTKEAGQDLAEKVAATSLDESNDIPVPAREAAHATGKTSNSSPEINKNIEGTAPQSNLESIPQLESMSSVTEIEVLNTEPVADVPAVISQLETSMAASKIESEAIASTNVHETKSPEPITSTEMHENEPKNENDFPKSNIISEQSTDVHVPEAPIEPIAIVPAPATVEAALEALPDTSKDGTVSVQSDLHESNVASAAEYESKPVSQPASASKVEVESPSESHESNSSEVSVVVPPVSTPSPPKTETENNTTEPELSIVQDAKVASVPEVNKPQTVSASEIPSDVPTIDPKPVIPIDMPKSESDSMSRASEQDKTPEKADAPVSDSPPLANTPSQEEASSVPAVKSEERRKPAAKLQLKPPTAADPLPTPDSELEDAASLAQSIIASELRTPTVTSPSPTACLASPQLQTQQQRLDVKKPDVPTPPIGAVSLSQIGIKPKAKPTTASQIESSVTEKEAEPPKKKVVKKVVKKDGASSGEAPVPPPRKKEKKPKEK